MFLAFFLAGCTCYAEFSQWHKEVNERYTINFNKNSVLVLCEWANTYLTFFQASYDGRRVAYPSDGYTIFFFNESGTAYLNNPAKVAVSFFLFNNKNMTKYSKASQLVTTEQMIHVKRENLDHPFFFASADYYWIIGEMKSESNKVEYHYSRWNNTDNFCDTEKFKKGIASYYGSYFYNPNLTEKYSFDVNFSPTFKWITTIPCTYVYEWDNNPELGYTRNMAVGKNITDDIANLRNYFEKVFSVNITTEIDNVFVEYNTTTKEIKGNKGVLISGEKPFNVTVFRKLDDKSKQVLNEFEVASMETLYIHITSKDIPHKYGEEQFRKTVIINSEDIKNKKLIYIYIAGIVVSAVLFIAVIAVSIALCVKNKEKPRERSDSSLVI